MIDLKSFAGIHHKKTSLPSENKKGKKHHQPAYIVPLHVLYVGTWCRYFQFWVCPSTNLFQIFRFYFYKFSPSYLLHHPSVPPIHETHLIIESLFILRHLFQNSLFYIRSSYCFVLEK